MVSENENTSAQAESAQGDDPPEPNTPESSNHGEPPAPGAELSESAASDESGAELSEPAASDEPSAAVEQAEQAEQGAGGEAEQPGETDHEADEAEASADGSESVSPDGDKPAKKKRRRKRKKKTEGAEGTPRPSARPATDRAPFHVGEEVFGKVTAVLDPAIMIDLSGKALAIFDRSEMEPDDLVPSVSDRFVARVHNDGSRGGLVVLTRKPLREEETKPFLEQAAKEGTHVQGLITGVIKGGVEVDIGGVRAFAPASGMDLHPQQANFTGLLGQRLDFKVVQYKNAGRDVVVTRRPMLEAEAHERRKHALTLLQEGQVLTGVVRTVVEWGAFVALPEAENLEGLVHISEASHDQRAKLTELMKAGDPIEVKIIKIDDKGKIWLSRKALIEDPWAEAKAKYAPGSRHQGKVTRLLDFGAFIELESGVEGLLHVSDLSLTRIEHPKEILSEGQELEVVVHGFDSRNHKISLHPAPPPERADEPHQKIAKGAIVKIEVVKQESSGLLVRVLGATGRGARGFVPGGHTGTARGTDLRKAFKIGMQLDAKIIEVDPRRGEPKLSIRAMKEDEERKAHRDYRQALQREGGFGTLGDLLAKKLKQAGGDDKSGD
jgi:small subunit ribosomal protein S1